MKHAWLSRTGLRTRIVSMTVVGMLVVTLAACIAAVPYAVKMVKEADMVKLNMEVDGTAADIYDAMVSAQKNKFPSTEIVKDDRDDLEFEGKRVEAGGVKLWGTWKAKQLDGNRTEVDIKLKAEGMEEDALEKRAITNINAFCAEIGKSCQIEK